MTEFLNSTFWKNLQAGVLPPVDAEVKVPTKIFVFTGLTAVLSAFIIIIVYNYSKK